jgi:exoribonuclease R
MGRRLHPRFSFMNPTELAQVLVALGCPLDKSAEMAAQLDKRAQQLATEKGRTYEEALTHLLMLMKQGWAAKEKGF